MTTSTVLTARILPELKEKLDALSSATKRARSWLVNDAIAKYLDENSWQVSAINEGLAQAKRGETVAHSEIESWLTTWGSTNERE